MAELLQLSKQLTHATILKKSLYNFPRIFTITAQPKNHTTMLKNFETLIFKLFFLVAFITLQSCQKENLSHSKEYPKVDAELWQYFEKFENEGQARGLEIDLIASGITGEIGTTDNTMWVGQCNHNSNQPNHVIINLNFWNDADDLRREKIVFHELGHCFLGKGHNDEKKEDGTCKSIMRAGTGECIDNYTEDNKHDYHDELFTL